MGTLAIYITTALLDKNYIKLYFVMVYPGHGKDIVDGVSSRD